MNCRRCNGRMFIFGDSVRCIDCGYEDYSRLNIKKMDDERRLTYIGRYDGTNSNLKEELITLSIRDKKYRIECVFCSQRMKRIFHGNYEKRISRVAKYYNTDKNSIHIFLCDNSHTIIFVILENKCVWFEYHRRKNSVRSTKF